MALRLVQCTSRLAPRVLLPCAAISGRDVVSGGKRGVNTVAPPPVTTLTEEEELMKESVARFARERVQPLVRKMDEESQMDPSIITDMFDQGLMGIEVESKYGGSQSTFFAAMLAIEELAKVDASVSVVCDVQNTLILDFFHSYASQRLKEKYLPRLATNLLGCYCLSEPHCGSDAFALTTRADKAGDHWVLNGQKSWITNAEHAGLFIVMANADFSKGYRGITAFVLERDMAGLTLGKKEDKLGIRASSTCPVFLENVKVPEENVIGEVGKGYKYAIESLNVGRIGIGAQMLGVAKGCLESVLPYVHDRMAFGQPLADFQAMQHMRAKLATDIEAASVLVYNTARMKDRGLPFIKQAAMAKYFTSEVASQVTSRCVEMLGGVGFTKEFPTEKFYRDSKVGQIYEGTSFIQLNTIAKCMDEEQQKK